MINFFQKDNRAKKSYSVNKDGEMFKKAISLMQSWGRPQNKTVLLVQLSCLSLALNRNSPEGDMGRNLQKLITPMSEDEFEIFLDQVYLSDVSESRS